MRIEIDIPKEFEEHFAQDKFKDSLERIMADIKHSLENGGCLCSGRYEHETIEMLEKAFEDSRQAYDIDKVVEELKEWTFNADIIMPLTKEIKSADFIASENAIEIVKQGGVSDDVCEWEADYKFVTDKYKRETGCGYTFYDLHHAVPFKFCPYCGKKIKIGGDLYEM